MACKICARPDCTECFHSIEEQEAFALFEANTASLAEARRRFRGRRVAVDTSDMKTRVLQLIDERIETLNMTANMVTGHVLASAVIDQLENLKVDVKGL